LVSKNNSINLTWFTPSVDSIDPGMGRRTSTGLVLFAWLGKRELPECKAYLAFTQLYDTSWYQHMKAIAKTLIRHQQDRTRASIYSKALTVTEKTGTACLFKTATSISPTADTVPSCTAFFFQNSFLLTLVRRFLIPNYMA